ncbi:MAG: PKD domain-containing protein, partial [Bacteroidales bacterium]
VPGGGIKTYGYQWQISTNKELWNDISGAVNSSYNTGNLTQTRYYRCRVTSGAQTGYTNELTITVNPLLVSGLVSQNPSICYNTACNISNISTATGGIGSITYQWQKFQAGAWTNVPGATGMSYTTDNLTATTTYRRVASNNCGSATSQTTISVAGELVSGQIGGTAAICYNTTSTLNSVSPASGGTGTISYQWQNSVNGNWGDISGANGLTYNTGNLTTTSKFRRKSTNSCGSVFSNEVTITVNPELLPGQISQNQTICYNTSTTILNITGASGSGTISYQWQKYQNGSWLNITGATGINYTIPGLTATTNFRRTAINSCGSAQSNEATITVNPDLTPGEISRTQTICKNTAAETLTNEISAAGGIGAITYQWQKSADGNTWNNIQNETNEYHNPGTLSQTAYYRRVASNSCGTVVTNPISVIVNPLPEFTLSNQAICKGNYTVINAPAGFQSYKWNTGESVSSISVNPQQTGIYSVTVANEFNCSVTKSMTLTVYPVPELTLENVQACEGANTVICAPAGFSSYLWSNGQAGQAISVIPFSTMNYTVYVTNAHGCQSSASMVLTVNPKPQVSVQSMTSCKGELVTFTAEPAGYPNYSWSNGNSSSNNMQMIADNSRNISLSVTDSKGCSNTANAFLTVNPKPEITLSDQEACYGENVIISAPSGYSSYVWNNGQTGINILNIKAYETTNYSVMVKNSFDCSQTATMKLMVNPLPELNIPDIEGCYGTALTVSAPMGYIDYLWSTGVTQRTFNTVADENRTYTVTVKNIKNCSNTSEVKLKVNPLPVINLADAYINQGGNYTITAPGGYKEYFWSNGNSGTNSITVSPMLTTNYSVTINDDNNCTGNDEMTLTVYDLPSVKIRDSVICEGRSVDILAPDGYKSYRWNNGTIGTNKITVSPAVTTQYTVEVTNETGGIGIGSMILTVKPLPGITCKDTLICKGNPLTLSTKPGYHSYSWSTGEVTSNISVSPEISKDYKVTVTDENGCINNKIIAVTVDDPLTEFYASRQNIHKGDFVSFVISSAKESNTYSWNFGDGFNSSMDNPLHYYNLLGDFDVTLTVTSNNNCSSILKKENYIHVVPDDVSFNETVEIEGIDVTIYPVPFRDNIIIKQENVGKDDVIKVTITDISGRIRTQKILTGPLNKIDTETLESGMYIFKIHTNHKEYLRKVIKY